MKRKKLMFFVLMFSTLFFNSITVLADEMILKCQYILNPNINDKVIITFECKDNKINYCDWNHQIINFSFGDYNNDGITPNFVENAEQLECPPTISAYITVKKTMYDEKYASFLDKKTKISPYNYSAVIEKYEEKNDLVVLGNTFALSDFSFQGFSSKKVSCGSGEGAVTGIPKKIPELTSAAFTIIQIIIPIILVIMGSIDLFKGITAGKEDEMKKGQQMFIKRLVVAAVIFFVVAIVKFLISVVADTNETNIVDCIDCFVSNDCDNDSMTLDEYNESSGD